jgi:hypothetical protein
VWTDGTLNIANTIVSDNEFDTKGVFASQGNNLIGATSQSSGWVGSDLTGVDPNLAPLAENGGLTRTRLPLPSSLAISRASTMASITTDQRGIARPQGVAPDIGAVERQATAAVATASSFEFETRQAVVFTMSADASAIVNRSTIQLVNADTNQPVSAGTVRFDDTGTQATLLLTNLLPDGNYRATLGPISQPFFVFAGDANRDRSINIQDFAILAAKFNQSGTFSEGDFNYSGSVDIQDFSILASKFNTTLPAARPPAGMAGSPTVANRAVFASGRSIWEEMDRLRE